MQRLCWFSEQKEDFSVLLFVNQLFVNQPSIAMTRKNEIHPNDKIAEAIISNPFLMLLLEHFEIKIPVHDLKIRQLCEINGINEELFIAFAKLYNGSRSISELKLSEDDALTIVRFLRASHSFYSDQIYPEIMELIEQMKKLNDHKEMKLVSLFFSDYFNEVTEHLDYENRVFHPYVMHLAENLKGKRHNLAENYSTDDYKDHHDDIEEKLNDLRNLLVKYLPVKGDYKVRRKLLFLLSELEYDLKIHSDIEELILIPLTVRLEKKLKNSDR